MKSQRQKRILELVAKYEIETQEDMMSRLQSEGFKVTQATVSRDLKELKLTKTLTARGTYRYAVNSARQHTGSVKFNNAMVDSIIQVEHSLNNIVIKTYPGLAQAVASGVDALNMHSILGCVAGDDTIIIVTRDIEGAEEISRTLTELMKTF
ncbi:MAG: arginine repressor [Clostridia bacterium]|nr:arginine repressor [Clostridia bacterium]